MYTPPRGGGGWWYWSIKRKKFTAIVQRTCLQQIGSRRRRRLRVDIYSRLNFVCTKADPVKRFNFGSTGERTSRTLTRCIMRFNIIILWPVSPFFTFTLFCVLLIRMRVSRYIDFVLLRFT